MINQGRYTSTKARTHRAFMWGFMVGSAVTSIGWLFREMFGWWW